ncbi:hypothetical protein [Ensifer aridi]|uniref:hypothetical protein n=1 Tax=Ensifer aridi TaxID=1708715 RepID=UPI001FCD2A6B|nr:hypothetical protein [Ensifer aridi]
MSEGMPLPWPFPWNLPGRAWATAAEIRSKALSTFPDKATSAEAEPTAFIEEVHLAATEAYKNFGVDLPEVKSSELYLIEGIAKVSIPETVANPCVRTGLAVIYPPEFLFVLDAGLDCLIGGTVTWQQNGLGDPGFPEKNEILLRSVQTRRERDLVFPKIAGSLIIGIEPGSNEAEIERELASAGLRDIAMQEFMVTASCTPFVEPQICKRLETELPFVKYAEPNGVIRLIDFSPGWAAKRLL